MIGFLKGKIKYQDINYILVETASGVGYKVFLIPQQIIQMKLEQEKEFYITEHIREDAHDLYGFLKIEELKFFQKAVAISGVGPKSAQNILGLGKISEIERAISEGDTAFLTRISGVGKKIAERIIIELKGKLDLSFKPQEQSDIEAIEALVHLGYTKSQASEAVNKASEAETTEEKIKQALRNL